MDTLIIIIIYFIVLFALSFYGRLRTKTADDFLIAGRKMPMWIAALSIAATLIGSGVTVGVGELGYTHGVGAILYPTILGITLLLSMWIAAARFRRSLVVTVPEMLERYYGVNSRLWTFIISLFIWIPPIAAQFLVGGSIISVVTGLPLTTSIIIGALIIIAYVILGGIWAVSLTDSFQIVVIFGGLIALAIFSLINFGGYGSLLAQLPPAYANPLNIGAVRFTAYLGSLLMLVFIAQPFLQRAASVTSPRAATKAGLIAGLIVLPVGFLAIFAGLIARIVLPDITPVMAVPQVMLQVFPSWVGALFFAAIIAATMSCADSWIHSVSTMFVKDVYQRFFNPLASDRQIYVLSMIFCLVLGGLGLALALTIQQEVIALVLLFIAPAALYVGPLLVAWFSPRKLKKRAGFAIMVVIGIAGIALSIPLVINRPPVFGVHPALTTTIMAYIITVVFLILPWTSTKFVGPEYESNTQ